MTGGNWHYRAGIWLTITTGLLLGWMNLAVGIAGAEDNPVNLSFFMLIAAAAVGAFAAEFRARGMARAMFAVALLQLLLGLIVSTGPVAAHETAGAAGLFALNGFFATLWLVSAALLARAARSEVPAHAR